MQKFKSKALWKNVLINIVSTGLLTGLTQLVVFPIISRMIDAEAFGIAVSLYGFNNLIVVFLGNTINNIRLIYDDKVEEKGNFSVLLLFSLAASFLVSLILYSLYSSDPSFWELFILIVFTVLGTLRSYLLVYFRLNLEYEKILYTNLAILLGYAIGMAIFFVVPFWGFIFLIGELLGVGYAVKVTPFLLEKPRKTENIFFLAKETVNLTFSNGVSNGLKYLDRFLITPVLGATSMSLYYSVSVFSKMINMVVIPFNNVLLSYINRMAVEEGRKYFLAINVASVILMIPTFIVLNLVTPFMLEILYPQFVEQAMPYIWIVNLANVFNLLTSISNPFILKLHQMKYQVNIQIIYGVVYVISAFYLSLQYGLMGFAVATAFSFFFKWVLMLILGLGRRPTTV